MATNEYIAHNENGLIGYFEKDHNNQKNYRASKALWFTASAMAKIQAVLKVNDISVCPIKATIEAFKSIGVQLEAVDFNRNKDALNKPEPELKANVGTTQSEILLKVARGETLNKAEMSLLSQKLSGSDSEKFEAEPVVTKPAEKPARTKELEALFAEFMAGAFKK